jgi:hypothetical protein
MALLPEGRLIHPVGDRHLGIRVAEGEQRGEALARLFVEALLADEQRAPRPIERVVAPPAVAGDAFDTGSG